MDNKSVFVGGLSFCAQRAEIALNRKSFGLEKPLVGMGGTPPGKRSKLHGTKVHGARARAFDVFCSQMS